MARQTAEQKRAAKDAKQKKLLFALIPVFLLLVVWQGPGYVSMITGGGEEAVPAPTPTATTTTPATTVPADPGAAPSTAAGATGTDTDAPVEATLPDSDAPVAAGAGQLVTFDLFSAKNPFEQQVEEVAPNSGAGSTGTGNGGSGGSSRGSFTDPGSGSGSGSGGGSGTGGTGATGGTSGTSGTSGSGGSGGSGGSQTSTAALTVNGTAERVSAGGAFPATDPVFRIESIGSSSVEVGLVSGAFSNGSETMKLSVGKTLTLVSQPDGLRYTIKLVAIS